MSHLAKSLINDDGKTQALREARDFLNFRKSIFFFLIFFDNGRTFLSYNSRMQGRSKDVRIGTKRMQFRMSSGMDLEWT